METTSKDKNRKRQRYTICFRFVAGAIVKIIFRADQYQQNEIGGRLNEREAGKVTSTRTVTKITTTTRSIITTRHQAPTTRRNWPRRTTRRRRNWPRWTAQKPTITEPKWLEGGWNSFLSHMGLHNLG